MDKYVLIRLVAVIRTAFMPVGWQYFYGYH